MLSKISRGLRRLLRAQRPPAPAALSGFPADLLQPPFGERHAQAFVAALNTAELRAAFLDFVVDRLTSRDHRGVFWGDRMLLLDRAAGFLNDPNFASAFNAVRGSHQYDQYASPDGIAWRMHTLVWAGRMALTLPAGDFVECGVFKGDMAWVVSEVTGLAATGREFHLYDSFEGFDMAQTSQERDFPDLHGFVEFANKVYSAPGLWEGVQARFAPLPHFKLHRGFLPQTLDTDGYPEKIAYLHVDLNVAQPEGASVERLFPRVVPGGVVVFDDYGWKDYGLIKKTHDAYFASQGNHVLELPTGQGLVIKR